MDWIGRISYHNYFTKIKKEYGTLFSRGDDKYYGTFYSQLLISTNGFVNFDNANGASSGNAIAAFNYDLITSYSGGIYY